MSFEDEIIPIQIRPDVVVRIANVPADLTAAEAQKIARVIVAMAAPIPLHQENKDGK